MNCRAGCGACCVAVSISSPIPGLPNGKPAGTRCPNLTEAGICGIWNSPNFPDICRRFQATEDFCGQNAEEALVRISTMEKLTSNPR